MIESVRYQAQHCLKQVHDQTKHASFVIKKIKYIKFSSKCYISSLVQ